MRSQRFLLDANIWVDAQVRDIFMDLDEAGEIEIYWSEPIFEEVERVLISRIGLQPASARSLLSALRECLLTREVPGDEPATDDDASIVPDPDDVHVFRAAVAAEADFLVTSDRTGFPLPTVQEQFDIEVATPDTALCAVGQGPLAHAFGATVDRLTRPALSWTQQIERLAKTCPTAADLIRAESALVSVRDLHGDELLDSATDRVNRCAELTDRQSEVMAHFTKQINDQTAALEAATASGDNKRMKRNRMSVDLRMAQQRKLVRRELTGLREERAILWSEARDATVRWIEECQLTDAERESSERLYAGWIDLRSVLDESTVAATRLRDSTAAAEDFVGQREGRELKPFIAELDAQVESTLTESADLAYMLQALGTRLEELG